MQCSPLSVYAVITGATSGLGLAFADEVGCGVAYACTCVCVYACLCGMHCIFGPHSCCMQHPLGQGWS